jgi:hypothetical protein
MRSSSPALGTLAKIEVIAVAMDLLRAPIVGYVWGQPRRREANAQEHDLPVVRW